MTADDVTLTEAECNGSPNCRAAVHEHGCFADNGDCTDPADHLPDLADRLAAVQAQLDAAMLRNIEYLRRAESAERRLAEVEARLAEEPCYVFRTNGGVQCVEMIGSTFPNGSPWTEEMCCLVCRVRAALANPPAEHRIDERGRAYDRCACGWYGSLGDAHVAAALTTDTE